MSYTEGQLLPIDIRVDIAPGAVPDGNPAAWQWRDVSSYRRQSSDIEIDYGRSDEASDVEAGSSSVELNLRDGLLSPRNPNSELYGLIGVNTPIRYRLPMVVDTFARTVASGWGTADTGQAWTVQPGGSGGASVSSGAAKVALVTAGASTTLTLDDFGALDLDMYYSASLSAVTTGGPWISAVLVRRVDASSHHRVHTEFKPSGVITCKIVKRVNGIDTDLEENLSVPVTYSIGSKVWNHVQVEGGETRIKVWSGLITDEPDAWTVTAIDGEVEGSIFGFAQIRLGTVTNAGTLTATIDDVRVDAILWSGNVPEWPPRWDKSGNDSTATLAAAGVMRRLDVGDDVSASALTNTLPSYLPVGYWPFEDGAESFSGASGISSGFAAAVTNVSFNADTMALPGSSAMAKLNGLNSRVSGRVSADTGPAFTAIIFFKMPSLPAGDTPLVQWDSGGTIVRYRVLFNNLGFRLEGDSVSAGITTTPLSTGTLSYVINPLAVLSIRLQITQSGGNIAWALAWNEVGDDQFWGFSGTVAGTAGAGNGVQMRGATGNVDMLFGQIWIGPTTIPYVDPGFLLISNGYDGERAAARIARNCAERLGIDDTGLPIAISTGADTDEPLGRQAPGKFLARLRDAAGSALGVLHERGNGLGYIPRGGFYNAPVIMTIPWSEGDLAEAPEPTDDDQRLRTRWTVSRTGGSSATYQNDTAAARFGVIGDSLEVNIQNDGRLLNYAAWKTALSTVDEMRWPTIVIDLVARPELIPFFLGCRIGSRIVITAPKSQVAGITIDLIIEGIKQTIGRRTWKVTLSCSPASPYSVGVYLADGATVTADTKRMDSRTSSLATAAGAADTAMTVMFTTLSDQWSQVNEPYLWTLAGETISVGSMGAVTQNASPSEGFESGVTGWTPVACVFAQSSTFAHAGTFSGRLTVSGSPTQAYVRRAATLCPRVVPGGSYTLSLWVRSAVNLTDVRASIDWLDASGGYISTSDSGSAALASGSFVQRTFTAVAPAGAAFAQFGPTMLGSPATSALLYVDDILLTTTAAWFQTATVTRAVNGVSKPQAAGAPVHVHPSQLARYAL